MPVVLAVLEDSGGFFEFLGPRDLPWLTDLNLNLLELADVGGLADLAEMSELNAWNDLKLSQFFPYFLSYSAMIWPFFFRDTLFFKSALFIQQIFQIFQSLRQFGKKKEYELYEKMAFEKMPLKSLWKSICIKLD